MYFFLLKRQAPRSTLFPYTTLFRSGPRRPVHRSCSSFGRRSGRHRRAVRSEEHTSELQSHSDLVCRLLLEKKKEDSKRTKQAKNLGPALNAISAPLETT